MERPCASEFDTTYLTQFAKVLKLPHSKLQEFWNLPYSTAVAIAQDMAIGGDSGAEYAITSDFALSLKGQRPLTGQEKVDTLTKKILRERLYQAQVITHFSCVPAGELIDVVQFEGLKHIEAAAASGRPVCLLNSHVGPGQLAPFFLAKMGYKVAYMGARNLLQIFGIKDHPPIEFLLTTDFHARTVSEGMRALQAGLILNTTGDGYSGKSGIKRPFLGKLRPVPEGCAYMIAQTNAISVPVFVQLDAQGDVSVTFHEPLAELPETAPRQERMDFIVQQYLSLLEQYWRSDFGNIKNRLFEKHNRQEDIVPNQRAGS